MTTQIEVPLSQLKIDPANVRRTDVKPSDQFVASIREEGILEPLTVRQNGAGWLVTNGGKRLAALAVLVKEKAIQADHPVPCLPREIDDNEARNISLAVNYMRDEMHPVDEFEAFADLIKGGMTAEAIGKKYGLKKKEVDQVLALGNLAPVIRTAWREEKIDEDAAQTFTMEPDQKRQAELFEQLRKRSGLNEWTVRKAILGEDQKRSGMIAFVGINAYKAAGGATAQDLFTEGKDTEQVTDLKLLKKLYDEKLKSRKTEIEGEGWKWVEFESDLPSNAHWWNAKGKNNVKAEDRGKYGVIIRVEYQGEVEIKYGVEKPAAEKAEAKKKAAKASGSSAISAALAGRLNEQITKATASVLEHDAKLGLIAVCAALTSNTFGGGTLAISSDAGGTAKFAGQFDLMRKKTPAELHAIMAKVAAESLSIGGSVQDRLPLSPKQPGDRALLEALDAKKLNAALRAMFDASDYFAGVTAEVCKQAIALCDPKYPFTGKEKKADLAKLAAKLVKESNAGGKAGYLPVEMRTAHYDGPAPKGAKPAKKKGR